MKSRKSYLKSLISQKYAEIDMLKEELIEVEKEGLVRVTFDQIKNIIENKPLRYSLTSYIYILAECDYEEYRESYKARTVLDDDGNMYIGGFINNDRFRGDTHAYVWKEDYAYYKAEKNFVGSVGVWY